MSRVVVGFHLGFAEERRHHEGEDNGGETVQDKQHKHNANVGVLEYTRQWQYNDADNSQNDHVHAVDREPRQPVGGESMTHTENDGYAADGQHHTYAP